MEEKEKNENNNEKKGISTSLFILLFIWIIGATTAAFFHTGVIVDFTWPFLPCLLISIGAGILLGIGSSLLFSHSAGAYLKNIFLGITSTVPVFLAIVTYVNWRVSFIRIEIILPILVGLLPFLGFAVLFTLMGKKNEPQEETQE